MFRYGTNWVNSYKKQFQFQIIIYSTIGEDEYGNQRDIIIAGVSHSDFVASIETLKEISGWEITDDTE